MQEFSISLRSFEDVQDFVDIATVQPARVTVGNEHQQINGKSFMGMFGLDYAHPLAVNFEGNDADAEKFRSAIARFLAD